MKFGKKRHVEGWDDMTDEVKEWMGNPDIFDDDKYVVGEKTKDPVIVDDKDDPAVISDEEKDLLRLGPKFCLYKNLSEEEFETDLEECIMKMKWDMIMWLIKTS